MGRQIPKVHSQILSRKTRKGYECVGYESVTTKSTTGIVSQCCASFPRKQSLRQGWSCVFWKVKSQDTENVKGGGEEGKAVDDFSGHCLTGRLEETSRWPCKGTCRACRVASEAVLGSVHGEKGEETLVGSLPSPVSHWSNFILLIHNHHPSPTRDARLWHLAPSSDCQACGVTSH